MPAISQGGRVRFLSWVHAIADRLYLQFFHECLFYQASIDAIDTTELIAPNAAFNAAGFSVYL